MLKLLPTNFDAVIDMEHNSCLHLPEHVHSEFIILIARQHLPLQFINISSPIGVEDRVQCPQRQNSTGVKSGDRWGTFLGTTTSESLVLRHISQEVTHNLCKVRGRTVLKLVGLKFYSILLGQLPRELLRTLCQHAKYCCLRDIISCTSMSARAWTVEDTSSLRTLNNRPRITVIDRRPLQMWLIEVMRPLWGTFLTMHQSQAHSFFLRQFHDYSLSTAERTLCSYPAWFLSHSVHYNLHVCLPLGPFGLL
jgi:hypothetical protein